VKTLILTPTQKEFDFFLQSYTRFGFKFESSKAWRLPVVQLPQLKVTVALGETGKAQFAVHTQHMLDSGTGWNLVICTGGAGALVDSVSIGDVVIAIGIVEHDYRNKFNQRPLPTFEVAEAVITVLQRAVLWPLSFKVHFGLVASGDEDVIEAERRRSLQQSTGALAVAWEGAGGARACAFSNVPFIEIRGITDAANHAAPADYDNNLELAMSNVAEVIISSVDRPLGTRERV
jgi:adenosylhomocysteine nucleosidase